MSDEPPVDKKNLSQVPSWIMVGFVVGVGVMWFIDGPSREPTSATPAAPTLAEQAAAQPNVAVLPDKPSLEVVEILFEQYREWVFWANDRTEIAVWNSQTLDFNDCYEVVRGEEGTFFRPIARLTRLPLEGYGPPDSPLLFTETADQRARRYNDANGGPPKRTPEPIDLKPIPRSPGGN